MAGRFWRRFGRLGGAVLLAGAFTVVALMQDTPRAVEAQAVQTIRVELNDFTIRPETLNLRAGQRVRFELVNVGQFRHSLEFEGIPDSRGPTVMGGQSDSYELTLTRPGPVTVFCPIACPGPNCHRDRGMVAQWAIVGGAISQVPRQLPRTGGTTWPPLALAGLGAGFCGLLLRRLRRAR